MKQVPAKVLPAICLDEKGSQVMLLCRRKFRETKGIIVNTFAELETFAVHSSCRLLQCSIERSTSNIASSWGCNSAREVKDKRKAKVLQEYCFNNNGLLSQEAIRMLDDGKLRCYSEIFNSSEIGLDSVVSACVYAKDVLHNAILGSVANLLPKWGCFKASMSGDSEADGLRRVNQEKLTINLFKATRDGEGLATP
ncbi:UDP-glucose flavonoid 3-O-glucosyltransferase 6-like isoform X1 [Daucus carota subsp. sativus]|uniref:UDP-glucose flavonoid 3-O-glucosyltransferase 6-like isoform X1 n=1 Tax=Daucus carota subsp. sativus TaxID=79200 RepID=UPI0030831C26